MLAESNFASWNHQTYRAGIEARRKWEIQRYRKKEQKITVHAWIFLLTPVFGYLGSAAAGANGTGRLSCAVCLPTCCFLTMFAISLNLQASWAFAYITFGCLSAVFYTIHVVLNDWCVIFSSLCSLPLAGFVMSKSGTLKSAKKILRQRDDRQKAHAVFLTVVETISSRVREGRHCASGKEMLKANRRDPPPRDVYVVTAGTGNPGTWKPPNAVFIMNFLPADRGWEIGGNRRKKFGCSSEDLVSAIIEGFVSHTSEAYFVERSKDRKHLTLCFGRFAPDGSFCGHRFYFPGRLRQFKEYRILPMSASKCQTHYGVECNGCDTTPLHGVRYKAKSVDYDLCRTCMENVDEVLAKHDTSQLRREDFFSIETPVELCSSHLVCTIHYNTRSFT